MESLAPSRDLVERFRCDLDALSNEAGPIALAVSGGPDSLALLLLATAALPGCVEALTVDHRLRRESTAEALHVEDICARLGCPHTILAVTVPDGPAGLQAEARRARYDALCTWAVSHGIKRLATAHHADDQAETMLMRLQRGSGVAGLSGIRPLRRAGALTILRPLLGWTKAELVHIVGSTPIEPVDDPTNGDPRFDRVSTRRFLADNPQFQPHRLARSAAACGEADAALDWMADALMEEHCEMADGSWSIDPAGLPREMKRRLLARVLASLTGGTTAAGPELERLLATLEGGGTSTLAGVRATGGVRWHLRPAPPRRAVPQA